MSAARPPTRPGVGLELGRPNSITRLIKRSQHSQECEDPRRQCFCDSWPWPLTFAPKYSGFLGRTVEHVYVKCDDPICIVFRDIDRADRQTDTRRWNTTPATAVNMGNNYRKQHWRCREMCRWLRGDEVDFSAEKRSSSPVSGMRAENSIIVMFYYYCRRGVGRMHPARWRELPTDNRTKALSNAIALVISARRGTLTIRTGPPALVSRPLFYLFPSLGWRPWHYRRRPGRKYRLGTARVFRTAL